MREMEMKAVELDCSPVEVAAGLQHLEGLVFFDSAGNFPEGEQGSVSVIAARPEKVLMGHLCDSVELEQEMQRHAHQQKSVLPNGGLCGWVEYDGTYCFGLYKEMLVYVHAEGQWYEVGHLSGEVQAAVESAPVQVGDFEALMSRAEYVEKVQRIREYIAAGDIYQVNLTQKFVAEVQGGSTFGLYQMLREASAAPHCSYMHLGGREVLSSSPETFLKFECGEVKTRPIKGTRPRFVDSAADQRSAYELRTSEKEVAELVMITDLERNDLGQVCEFGSVRVEAMLKLEKYEQVYHLVSSVTGKLATHCSQIEALRACFPGGSITGAPKKRAMEIIEELEGEPRGLYTGTMGYFGFNGVSQFSIVIRTLVREGNALHYHVGAGIVADSDAQAEYEETLQKALGMRLAVEQYGGEIPF